MVRAERLPSCPRVVFELLQQESQEALELYYDQLLSGAERLVKETGFAKTWAGKIALWYLLAQSAAIRPLLRSTSRLFPHRFLRKLGERLAIPTAGLIRLGEI